MPRAAKEFFEDLPWVAYPAFLAVVVYALQGEWETSFWAVIAILISFQVLLVKRTLRYEKKFTELESNRADMWRDITMKSTKKQY